MCRSKVNGGRRCGALAHARVEGKNVREAVRDAVSEASRAVKAAADGDAHRADRAARTGYAAFKRADAAQRKAHEHAAKATSDRARAQSARTAAFATLNASKAAKAAKVARAAAKRIAPGSRRGVLGSEETPSRISCRVCQNTGKVTARDEDNNPLGEVECLDCDGRGFVLSNAA